MIRLGQHIYDLRTGETGFVVIRRANGSLGIRLPDGRLRFVPRGKQSLNGKAMSDVAPVRHSTRLKNLAKRAGLTVPQYRKEASQRRRHKHKEPNK